MSEVKETKVLPVLYYDLSQVKELDLYDQLENILKTVDEYFKRDNIPFLVLPKDITELQYISKEEALDLLNKTIAEVEKWQ